MQLYAWEIVMAQFQNGSKSRSRDFLQRWLTFSIIITEIAQNSKHSITGPKARLKTARTMVEPTISAFVTKVIETNEEKILQQPVEYNNEGEVELVQANV